jgi:hypothetical protein
MCVFSENCVLSGKSLCNEPITSPGGLNECSVAECDREAMK